MSEASVTERSLLKPMLFFGWVAGLSILILAGLIAASQVFFRGLVVTNLSDLVPWGLWITIDLSSIAMAAGAFSRPPSQVPQGP